MNNRERQWYEGKHERHPATCNCVDCVGKRRAMVKEDATLAEEQARMRDGAEERVAWIKKWIGKRGDSEKK